MFEQPKSESEHDPVFEGAMGSLDKAAVFEKKLAKLKEMYRDDPEFMAQVDKLIEEKENKTDA